MTNDHAPRKQEEIDRNLAFFLEQLPKILTDYGGKFALIRHKKIVGYYDTALDAVSSATQLYPDGMYSVQQVTNVAVNLGIYQRWDFGRCDSEFISDPNSWRNYASAATDVYCAG
jgi:hypothetical protein